MPTRGRATWSVFLALVLVFFGSLMPKKAHGSDLAVLFQADFEGAALGPVTAGPPWASVTRASGEIAVALDENELFARGPGNRYLRVRDANGATLRANLSAPREIVTLQFTFIGRLTGNDDRWVQFNLLAGSGSFRAHIHSLQITHTRIRSINTSYGENDVPIRFSVIMNNSGSAHTYVDRQGGSHTVQAGQAAVWGNGLLLIPSHVFARDAAGTGPIQAVSIQADSNSYVSFDLDDMVVLAGADTGSAPPQPPPPMATLGEDGRLRYTADSKGNRIPDFSNAGYMGGGVEIPEVPVRLTVFPQPTGDDTARIQVAINQVAALPLDADGFRGAILFKAGEYRISGSLRVAASGVVLRGEGDGPEGTIFRATGTTQRTLIQIRGTGSRWTEVANTRREITDAYVPVGGRTFSVTSAAGYQVGDTIIVHRPSTAEWISAIGMDQIPPRSDGLPVTQWQPGSYDLSYDRVIVAIDGNRITIDAPLVNALDAKYGGGSIYRYTFPGRISQVGVEHIRSVSDFAGGAWTTSRTDEEHAWTFIELNMAQNGWVRNTTALHYGFGNTLIERFAKWITVQDSQNLFPVSLITGSRRYPFYIVGQLSLIQRCYANFARHDFGTSSLTHGPNVFLQGRGDSSYSDTGPHHRWATGSLYDNIVVEAQDIAVQNRLNFGSGHGWAGANHVVWNSRARRIVVQNPPTAQNWAIGVIGQRWAGAFPAYAADGYWISHGARVDPDSLYLQQLADRLGPGGEGGMISTLSFAAGAEGTISPQTPIRLSLQRLGIRERSTPVEVSLAGRGADLLEIAASTIPAFAGAGELEIRLRKNAAWVDSGLVTVRLLPTERYSVGPLATATIFIPATPRGEWRARHFTEEERLDPAVSGDQADPAGDLVPNLLKYAFDLDPWVRTPPSALPGASLSDGRLALEFKRGRHLTDLVYRVEVSADLHHWQDGAGLLEEQVMAREGDWEHVLVRDLTPIQQSERRFLRLSVQAR